MRQLLFSMRPVLRCRQTKIGSRSARQLTGDIHDLEVELCKKNDSLFVKTGLSWARHDIEELLSGHARGEGELPREAARIAEAFPSDVVSISRLQEDRRQLIGRLMSRSREWEHEFHAWPWNSSSRFPGYGLPDEQADFNPYHYLDSVQFPFPDPVFGDSCWDFDGDDEDHHPTVQYQDVHAWLWNDVDEWKIAQLDADLRDTIPWDGSWQAYQLRQHPELLDPDSDFGVVLAGVQRAREARFEMAMKLRAKAIGGAQMPLWEATDAVRVQSQGAAGPGADAGATTWSLQAAALKPGDLAKLSVA